MFLKSLVLTAALAVVSFAADATGSWKAEYQTPNGEPHQHLQSEGRWRETHWQDGHADGRDRYQRRHSEG